MKQIKPIPFTKEGYENLKKELEAVQNQRPEAVKNLKFARDLGDLSENSLYKGARARLTGIDATIRRLTYQVRVGYIVETSKDHVGIGTSVIVSDGAEKLTYHIVGDTEANPKERKISQYSPIGKALFKKKVGDIVKIETPKAVQTYKILEITINE